MTSVLVIIYLSFITLGLPDSLLGSAWPVMHTFFNVPQTYAGILSAVTATCTVVSSFFAFRITKKIGTGKTIAVSTLLTSVALFLYATVPSFWLLIPSAVILGFGAGAIDSALNNYVSLHYESRHMSFLHASWGIGATLGSLILAFGLDIGDFQTGYIIIASIQLSLSAVQFLFIRKFDKAEGESISEDLQNVIKKDRKTVKTGVFLSCMTFVVYCFIENSMFIWIATYCVDFLKTSEVSGAHATSLFFLGITLGRILSGLISGKINTKAMIYIGSITGIVGGAGIFLSSSASLMLVFTFICGLGFAPLFPSMIHRTPKRFGVSESGRVIGLQMASANIGTLVGAPAFGFLILKVSFSLFPILIMVFMAIIIILTRTIERNI